MERSVKRAARERVYTFTTSLTTVSGGNRWQTSAVFVIPVISKSTDFTGETERLVYDWSQIDTWL